MNSRWMSIVTLLSLPLGTALFDARQMIVCPVSMLDAEMYRVLTVLSFLPSRRRVYKEQSKRNISSGTRQTRRKGISMLGCQLSMQRVEEHTNTISQRPPRFLGLEKNISPTRCPANNTDPCCTPCPWSLHNRGRLIVTKIRQDSLFGGSFFLEVGEQTMACHAPQRKSILFYSAGLPSSAALTALFSTIWKESACLTGKRRLRKEGRLEK